MQSFLDNSIEIEMSNELKRRPRALPAIAEKGGLGKTPACYSGDGWTAFNLRPDDELKHPNAVKINFVIFDLND